MAGVSAAISSRESRKGQVVEPTPLDRLLGRFPANATGHPEKHTLTACRVPGNAAAAT